MGDRNGPQLRVLRANSFFTKDNDTAVSQVVDDVLRPISHFCQKPSIGNVSNLIVYFNKRFCHAVSLMKSI
jgi:hypothetical protein